MRLERRRQEETVGHDLRRALKRRRIPQRRLPQREVRRRHRGIAERTDQAAHAERIRHDQRLDACDRPDRQRERDDEPVVPIAARVLDHQQLREIGRTDRHQAVRDAGVLHLPEPRRGRAREVDRRGNRRLDDATRSPDPPAVVSNAWVLTSNELQSIGPSISAAENVISSPALADNLAPTDSAYSSRGGFHASSVGPPGSLYIESYQVEPRGRGLLHLRPIGGSDVQRRDRAPAAPRRWCAAASASCRPSGARPTIDCMYRDDASSTSAELGVSSG